MASTKNRSEAAYKAYATMLKKYGEGYAVNNAKKAVNLLEK